MSDVKERIIGAVTVMSEPDAAHFWQIIRDTFGAGLWDMIPEEAPDAVDLEMLNDIRNNPECQQYVSQAEAMRVLGLAE